VVSTGDGNDLAIGGAAGDTVTSAGGSDILFGDGIDITFSSGGSVIAMISHDEMVGGNDTLDGGAGNDILVAGQGDDLLFGNLSEDLLFGGNAAVTEDGGIIKKIETDTHDLVTQALFEEFDSVSVASEEPSAEPSIVLLEDLPGYAAFVADPLAAFPHQVELLSVAIFEKLFNSAVVSHLVVPSHPGASVQVQAAGSQDGQQQPQQDQSPQQDPAPQQGDASQQGQAPQQDPGAPVPQQEQAAPGPQEQVPTAARTSLELQGALVTPSPNADESGAELLAATAGLAGLVSQQKSRTRMRKLLDRDAMAGVAVEHGAAGEARVFSRPRRVLIEW
jgi:hypothetical protein